MLSVKRIPFLLGLIVICKILISDAMDNSQYGPYNIEFDRFESCAGPKSRNVTRYDVGLTKEGNDVFLKLNVTFLEQCYVDEVKVAVYATNGNKKNLLLNYKITDPCHHFTLANGLATYLNATKCLVKKGTYVPLINLSEGSKSFLSSAFFYGDFLMKTTMWSKKGNILCFSLHSIFTKKT